jgi:hypothetical protein
MDATFIAIILQIGGWGLFFRGVHQMRRETWRRGPMLLFWISGALLGCSTFCFAAAPLLNWGQIAWLMLTGGLCAVLVSALWGAFSGAPRIGPLKASDTARADTGGIRIRTTPRTVVTQPLPTGRGTWASATVRNIEAMEVNI